MSSLTLCKLSLDILQVSCFCFETYKPSVLWHEQKLLAILSVDCIATERPKTA